MSTPQSRDITVPEDLLMPGIFPDDPRMAKAAGLLVHIIQLNDGDWSYELDMDTIDAYLSSRVQNANERAMLRRGVLVLGANSYFDGIGTSFRLKASFVKLFRT